MSAGARPWPVPRRAAGLLLAALAAGAAQAQAPGDHRYASEEVAAGLEVYSRDCALCHGPGGDLVDGIDLRRGVFPRARSDDELRAAIAEGTADGRMPGFDLDEARMNGLIAYIRAGFDPEGVAVRVGDPRRGRELFQGKGGCAGCHRVNGTGPRVAPDLSAIGVERSPAVLQRNLLDPAGALWPINRAARIVTRGGEEIEGRRLNEDTYSVQLIDARERLRSLDKADIVRYELSDGPSKPPADLSAAEAADVLGYLLTLRGPQ